jgi:hypothetical protein
VARAGRQERPHLRAPCATARTEEAVGVPCDAPSWHSMLEEAVEQRFGGQRAALPPGAAALVAAERAGPVFERFQAVGGQGNPGEVGGAGGETLRASAGRLAVGHPGLLPDLGRHGSAKACGSQGRLDLAPEELRARTDGHEPASRARRVPRRALW